MDMVSVVLWLQVIIKVPLSRNNIFLWANTKIECWMSWIARGGQFCANHIFYMWCNIFPLNIERWKRCSVNLMRKFINHGPSKKKLFETDGDETTFSIENGFFTSFKLNYENPISNHAVVVQIAFQLKLVFAILWATQLKPPPVLFLFSARFIQCIVISRCKNVVIYQ